MLSMMSRSRWVPTRRTSWPLSVKGTVSAEAMIPEPRIAIVAIRVVLLDQQAAGRVLGHATECLRRLPWPGSAATELSPLYPARITVRMDLSLWLPPIPGDHATAIPSDGSAGIDGSARWWRSRAPASAPWGPPARG